MRTLRQEFSLFFYLFCGGAARSPCTPGGLGDYLSWLLVEGCTGCARQYGFKRVARSKRFHREGAYSPPADASSRPFAGLLHAATMRNEAMGQAHKFGHHTWRLHGLRLL